MTGEKTLLMSKSDLLSAWSGEIEGVLAVIEDGFAAFARGAVILPEKASQVFDADTQDRINCMPSTVRDLGFAGVKWVSVFPENPRLRALPNVGGVMVLSEIEAGRTVAVMDAAALTAIRTAAVDAVAARYLAPSNIGSVAIIGTGEQAAYHARFLAPGGSGIEVRVSGRTPSHADSLASALRGEGILAVSFGGDMEAAVGESDIVVTAISGQAPVLRADWIRRGCLYCHVGGWEDEYGVADRADKIVCDNWNALKHRGSPTIARMYSEGLLDDSDIFADLHEIISGKKVGRADDREFIYFNAIGLSFVDVSVASWLLKRAVLRGLGTSFDFDR